MTKKTSNHSFEEMHIIDVMKIIYNRRYLILGLSVAGLILGVIYFCITPKSYKINLYFDEPTFVEVPIEKSDSLIIDPKIVFEAFIKKIKSKLVHQIGVVLQPPIAQVCAIKIKGVAKQ